MFVEYILLTKINEKDFVMKNAIKKEKIRDLDTVVLPTAGKEVVTLPCFTVVVIRHALQ